MSKLKNHESDQMIEAFKEWIQMKDEWTEKAVALKSALQISMRIGHALESGREVGINSLKVVGGFYEGVHHQYFLDYEPLIDPSEIKEMRELDPGKLEKLLMAECIEILMPLTYMLEHNKFREEEEEYEYLDSLIYQLHDHEKKRFVHNLEMLNMCKDKEDCMSAEFYWYKSVHWQLIENLIEQCKYSLERRSFLAVNIAQHIYEQREFTKEEMDDLLLSHVAEIKARS